MSSLAKWSLPAVAFAVVLALAGVRAGAQEDAGAAAKGKVTGTIQNEDGTPAANVTVRLVVPPSRGDKKAKKEAEAQAADEGARPAADEEKPRGNKPGRKARPEPVATGKTDASGKFELEAPAGKYTLMANLRGQGRVQKTFALKAGQTKDLGTLTLKKPAPKKEATPAE